MLLSNAIINYNDGTNKKVAISSRTAEERIEKYLFDDASLDYEKISSIDFPLNQSPISAGDDGFYLISGTSSVCRESSIGYFREREDLVHENKLQHLPIFGLCHGDICFISITTGMQYDSYAVIEVKDGNYNFYLRFLLDGEKPYEALTFELHMLEGKDKTYSGMGS